MSIDIEVVEEGEFDRWNEWVERSPDANPFHRSDALDVQATHSETELHPLVGYKGKEPVGLFPFFEQRKGPLTAALSPPTGPWAPRLGPVLLNMEKLKRRKAERRLRRFVEGCLEWVEATLDPDYLHLVTVGSFEDVRPFKWSGADVTPVFTYVVDLTVSEEELLAQFSSDARKNIDWDEAEYTVAVGGRGDVERIIDQVRRRYESQDETFRLPTSFATALYDRLPDGRVRPYVCRVEGEYVGGVLAVEDDDRIYAWQGGAKPDRDVPANELLYWHIMTDARRRGIAEYDLVGAGELRLTGYKAKFAPALETFYHVEDGRWPVTGLVDVYTRLR